MRTKPSTLQPSRAQLETLQDLTADDAPSRASRGKEFWRTAIPRYPSKGPRNVRVRLDPEVMDWFRIRKGADPEAINSVLRHYVEKRKAEE